MTRKVAEKEENEKIREEVEMRPIRGLDRERKTF